MRKFLCILVILAMLTGCSAPVYETLGNVIHVGGSEVKPRQILLAFPEDATLLTAAGEDRLYLCGDYTLTLQTHTGGDVAATVLALTGQKMGSLTVIDSLCGDHGRKDFVWITNAEEGQQLCRAAVLDDGNFHYSLTVIAGAQDAADLTEAWNALFSSFCLETQKTA